MSIRNIATTGSYFRIITTTILLNACSGGSGSNSPAPSSPPPTPQTIKEGVVKLGPVAGANIDIFNLDDLESPACSTTSNSDNDLSSAGRFTIPNNCIQENLSYLIVASGGVDIDADDDGKLDATPTQVQGIVRALVNSKELTKDNWKVSALTESVFQALKHNIAANTTPQELEALKKMAASTLILEDVDNNKKIDYADILAWDPKENKDNIIDNSRLNSVLQSIHNGNNTNTPTTTDPSGPFEHLPLGGSVAAVSGDLLLLASDGSLVVVATPANKAMQIVGSLPVGSVYDIIIKDDIAYLATGELGIQIIDISNPSQPVKLSSVAEKSKHITMYGNTLLAGIERSNTATLINIDISNPASPLVVSSFTLAQKRFLDLAVHQNHLYHLYIDTKTLEAGVSIYNLSSPQTPSKLGDGIPFQVDGWFGFPPSHMSFDGDTLFLQSAIYRENNKLLSFDISNPAQPLLTDSIDKSGALIRAMTTNTDSLYQLNLSSYDIIAPAYLSIHQLPNLSTTENITLTPGQYSSILLSDTDAYIIGTVISRIKLSNIKRSTSSTGYALLGRVIDADVTIQNIDSSATTPACVSKTNDHDYFEKAGNIQLDLDCVTQSGMYLVTVSGGFDIDANNDEIRDATPTQIHGSFHALLSNEELEKDNWQVTALTDASYQLLKDTLPEFGKKALTENLAHVAQLFLKNDLDGNGRYTNRDILSWHPIKHGLSFLTSAGNFIDPLRNAITNNDDTTTLISTIGFTPIQAIQLEKTIRSISAGDGLVAAISGDQVQIFNSQLPYSLSALSTLQATNASQIFIDATTLYIAYPDGRLQVFDLSTPDSPALLGGLSDAVYLRSPDITANMLVHNSDLYIISQKPGSKKNELLMIDISVRSSPSIRKRYDLHDGWQTVKQRIYKNSLYILRNNVDAIHQQWQDYIDVYNIADIDNSLEKVSSIKRDTPENFVIAGDISFHRDLAYVVYPNKFSLGTGFTGIYDVSVPSTPQFLNSVLQDESSLGIATNDDGLYQLHKDRIDGHQLPTLDDVFTRITPTINTPNAQLDVNQGIAYVSDEKLLFKLNLPVINAVDSVQGKLRLGRIVDASVSVHKLRASNGPEECNANTLDNNVMNLAGTFSIDYECIDDAGLYLLSSHGGNDIDRDNNNLRDASPTPIAGTMHAIVSISSLSKDNWNINPLTEAAYQLIKNDIAGNDDQTVITMLNNAATLLINTDLNNDNEISHSDLLAWDPVLHGSTNLVYSGSDLTRISNAIRDNDDIRGSIHLANNDRTIALIADAGLIKDMIGNNNLLIARGQNDNVHIIDRQSPILERLAKISTEAHAMLLNDTTLYIAGGRTLSAYDLSDPANPTLQDSVDDVSIFYHGFATGGPTLILRGNTLLVATSAGVDSGFVAIDVGDPSNLATMASTSISSEKGFIQIHDHNDILFTTTMELGLPNDGQLTTWDISDPTAMTATGFSTDLPFGETFPFEIMSTHNNQALTIGYRLFNPICKRYDMAVNGDLSNVRDCPTIDFGTSVAVGGNYVVHVVGKQLLTRDFATLSLQSRHDLRVKNIEEVVVIGDNTYVLSNGIMKFPLP